MPAKTLVFILGAVIALIIIVVLAGMRYLRADDVDDYEDEPEDDHGGPPDDVVAARRAGASRASARSRPAGGASWRGDQDRDGRDRDSGPRDRGDRDPRGRGPAERTSRSPRRDLDDRADSDSSRSRGNWQKSGGSVPGNWDENVGAGWADDTRIVSADERPGRDDRAGAGRDSRAGRGNTGSHSRPNGRGAASGLPGRDDNLPDVRPRRSGKSDDSDWQSKKWDELSDVDYWAELAADKPFSSPSELDQPAPRGERSGSRRDSDAGQSRTPVGPAGPARSAPSRNGQSRGGSATDPAQKLPVRSPRQDRSLDEPAGVGGPVGGPGGSRSGGPGGPGRSGPTMPPVRRSAAGTDATAAMSMPRVPQAERSWPVAPANDDPLTSPSFPKITDDSRSYRRSRGEGSGQRDGSAQREGADSRDRRATGEQSRQFPSYPLPAAASPYDSGSRLPRSDERRAASDPASAATGQYSYPAAAQAPFPAGQHVQADPYSSGDQYGQRGYQAGTGAYQTPPAPIPSAPAASSPGSPSGPHSYPGRAAAQTSGPHSYPPEPPPAGYSAGNYQAPAAGMNGYGAQADSGALQAPAAGYPDYSQPAPADPYAQPAPYPPGYVAPAAQPAGPTAVYQLPAAGQDYASQNGFGGYGTGQFPDNGYQQVPAGYRPGDYQAAPYAPPAHQVPGYEPPAVASGDPYAVDPYGQAGYGGGGF